MPCFKPSSPKLHAAARSLAGACALVAGLLALPAHAGLGQDEIPGLAGDGPVTLY